MAGLETKVKHRRSAVACTSCRQSKLKCDSIARLPGRCSRCEKLNVFCEIDSNFRRQRIGGHARLSSSPSDTNNISNHLHKSSIANNSSIPEVKTREQTPNSLKLSRFCLPFPELSLVEDEIISDGGIRLPGPKIKEMFQTFYDLYYPIMPVIRSSLLDPDVLTGDKRVLLWAICYVTCSVCAPDLKNPLAKQVESLLSNNQERNYMVDPDTCLIHIYALLILCRWPLPHNSMQEDLSWLHCARALNLAMLIGIHRSSYVQEYSIIDFDSSREQIESASLLWISCFIVNQLLGALSGLPCQASLNAGTFSNVSSLCQQSPEIAQFVKQGKILSALQRGINLLGNCPDTKFGQIDPAVRGMVHRATVDSFSQLIAEIAPFDDTTELICLASKLQFHSFLLAPDTLPSDQKSIIIPLYYVCMKIVNLTKGMLRSRPVIEAWPQFYLNITIMAATILFALSISEFGHMLEQEQIRNCISDTHHLMSLITKHKGDIAARGMRVLSGLQQMVNLNLIVNPIFTVRTRLGASAFWSPLLLFKRFQQKERVKANCETEDTNTDDLKSDDSDIGLRFDKEWEWGFWNGFDCNEYSI